MSDDQEELPPGFESRATRKPINPWKIFALVLAPGLLAIPIGYAIAIDFGNSAKVDFLIILILALPIISGIWCTVIFVKDGFRIQSKEDPDLTNLLIISRSIIFGITCAIGSLAFLWGACSCLLR